MSYNSIKTYTTITIVLTYNTFNTKPLNKTTLVRMQGNSQDFSYSYITG